ncbi:MAG: DUF3047 domain-containing protein [Thermodesulfobacteriota bacterium]|nr:DUF3047 domain-containing protein [Thermodesulfobacteriota bacterium]
MKEPTIILVFLVLSSLASASAADRKVLGGFSSGRLDGWEPKVFMGETRYLIARLDQTQVLRAESHGHASGLVKNTPVDLRKYPFLNWSWRIENRLDKRDEQSKSGDDYAARIYIVVSRGWLFWKTKAISYVWANTSPKGHVWPNAFGGKNAMMVALRSADDETGTWHFEKRNVAADFQELFGEEIQTIDAVALMTDTDNSKGKVTAFYGDIYFSAR